MTHFGDPQFTAHQAMGRVWGQMVLMVATSPLLPYHPTDYARRLNETYDQLIKTHGDVLEENTVDTGEHSSNAQYVLLWQQCNTSET